MKRQRNQRVSRRRKRNDRLGATAVEFAVVANVMFVLMMTCMEFARLNMVRNLAQDAAYFAARQVIVVGADESEAIAEADRIMSSMLTNGYTITVDPMDFDEQFAEVVVSVDLNDVALFAPMFLPNTNLETRARLRTERYSGFYEQ